VKSDVFSTWLERLAARSGAADSVRGRQLPAEVTVRPCADRAQEAASLAAHLRAWRLAGIESRHTAVLSTRTETVQALLDLTQAKPDGMIVGELGRTDVSDVKALALVGCDHRFFAADAGDFGTGASDLPRDQASMVVRACAAPTDHLLVTWRGRPDTVFAPLGDSA
jgi:hypothetical protein